MVRVNSLGAEKITDKVARFFLQNFTVSIFLVIGKEVTCGMLLKKWKAQVWYYFEW